ncbi:MAG: type I pullulanase [Spirochaetales bacterium]|nr:type I pullulanase [Spirochaetales bacterium]
MREFPASLAIDLEPGSSRRVAWGDRAGGYLDLDSSRSCRGEGWVSGEAAPVRDALELRSGVAQGRESGRIRVQPGNLWVEGEDVRLRIALLMEQNALALALEGSGATAGSGTRKPHAARKNDGVALVLPRSDAAWSISGHEGIFTCARAVPGPTGALALASVTPFRHVRARAGRGLVIPTGFELVGMGFAATPRADSLETDREFVLYVATAPTPDEAAERAADLARRNALAAHEKTVAAFLEGLRIRTGGERADKALAWAAFSGWSLVTRDAHGLGVWAGLPWFRDNWGRDTFIALPGILLATGRFEEAREVIETFAARQNLDPASPDCGRVPNRWRGPDDVIYNTADGTPWLVREIWDLARRTGDREFLLRMKPFVDRALDADQARCDAAGFLRHGDADTWMDARLQGAEPWSPRGDRAVEVQALHYTALLVGARVAALAGDSAREARYRDAAALLRASFRERFIRREAGIVRLADRLRPDAPDGTPGEPDWSARPNAFMAITVPAVFEDEEALLEPGEEAALLADLVPELVYPYGVASLSQEDPRFHPRHSGSALWQKDAAYHNGTIWAWNSGFAVSALLRHGQVELARALRDELARQILDDGAVGALSENLDALPGPDGLPAHSGTFAQAWSVSEFVRNAAEDWLGLRPDLLHSRVALAPRVPENARSGSLVTRLASTGSLSLSWERCDAGPLELELDWSSGDHGATPRELGLRLELACPEGDRAWDFTLVSGAPLTLRFDEAGGKLARLAGGAVEADPPGPGSPARLRFAALRGLAFATPRLPPWNGPSREKDWLEKLVSSGAADSGEIATLKSWFDSPEFTAACDADAALGALWSPGSTTFRVWAPTATHVTLALYRSGDAGEEPQLHPMSAERKGVWETRVSGDLHGSYYAWRLRVHGLARETIDPYARSAGLNGHRGMVLDPARAAPEGWSGFRPPECASPCDAVVYEVHVDDLTSRDSWGGDPKLRDTYAGAALGGTRYRSPDGVELPTGFDHVRSLGVTHLQLLPVFDFVSVDEARVGAPDYAARREGGAFNWGYDPGNWNAPEGSYSGDPADGEARVRELRTLVKAAGEAGMGVVMDVVYNHVPDRRRSPLEACVPGYYFRDRRDSGAGDDTASERFMFARFMADSLAWWLEAYKLSGFRFDLMGLHDAETMRRVERRLRMLRPDVLLWGEGWDLYRGGRMVPASQANIRELPGFGMFNDAFRDGVKGSVFDAAGKGWIHDGSRVESVKFGLAGAVRHRQVRSRRVEGSANPKPWGNSASSSLAYVEVHDNLTLHDKLLLVEPGMDESRYARLQRLALSLVLGAQGTVILHAGSEFLRSKEVPAEWLVAGGIDKCVATPDLRRFFCHDSYKAGRLLNGLDWRRAASNQATVEYLRRLIELRKTRPCLRMVRGSDIRAALRFTADSGGVLAWRIDGGRARDGEGSIFVAANSNEAPCRVRLPRGRWALIADSGSARASIRPLDAPREGAFDLPGKSLFLFTEA